jgi:hypothetical protein
LTDSFKHRRRFEPQDPGMTTQANVQTAPDLQKATTFIWSNARLLDRHRFARLLRGGDTQPVLEALRAYQNTDGGFGNALEPDLRAPVSQPQPVEFALHVLDELDAMNDPMVVRACDYLLTITMPDGGVPFVLPMAEDFPRAPWWNADANPPASVNPTAAIAGLLHKHAIQHSWLGPATEFCWREIERGAEFGGYDFASVFTFLQYVPDRSRADRDVDAVGRRLFESGQLTLDEHAEGHVFMPLQFAPTPDSPQRRLFDDDTIERHLDALVARQQDDGGWPISWQPPSEAAVMEWRGSVTVGTLQTLRANGRLPAS